MGAAKTKKMRKVNGGNGNEILPGLPGGPALQKPLDCRVRWTSIPVMEFTCPKCEQVHGVPDREGEAAAFLKSGKDGRGECQNCGVELRLYHSDLIVAASVMPS